MGTVSRIVVFDLDETLGYFQEFGIFWNSLSQTLSNDSTKLLSQSVFNAILDLFPEFLRPDILHILEYLKDKKNQGCCTKVMIYTNNQAHTDWSKRIQHYFDNKLEYDLFDRIIGAFKINNEIVEICRSRNSKTIDDLICCTQLPPETQICFIDDVLHPGMVCENVFYINIKPYIHCIPFDTMIERFLNSKILYQEIKDKVNFKVKLLNIMNKYKYNFEKKSHMDYNIDKILSKKILEHLHSFFKIQSPGTMIKKYKKTNKTRKR